MAGDDEPFKAQALPSNLTPSMLGSHPRELTAAEELRTFLMTPLDSVPAMPSVMAAKICKERQGKARKVERERKREREREEG
jgi:hypothetical protein